MVLYTIRSSKSAQQEVAGAKGGEAPGANGGRGRREDAVFADLFGADRRNYHHGADSEEAITSEAVLVVARQRRRDQKPFHQRVAEADRKVQAKRRGQGERGPPGLVGSQDA